MWTCPIKSAQNLQYNSVSRSSFIYWQVSLSLPSSITIPLSFNGDCGLEVNFQDLGYPLWPGGGHNAAAAPLRPRHHRDCGQEERPDKVQLAIVPPGDGGEQLTNIWATFILLSTSRWEWERDGMEAAEIFGFRPIRSQYSGKNCFLTNPFYIRTNISTYKTTYFPIMFFVRMLGLRESDLVVETGLKDQILSR